MKYLENKHGYENIKKGTDDWDVYSYANFRGHIEIVKYLESTYECNTNDVLENDPNPFMKSICSGNLELIKYHLTKPNINDNLKKLTDSNGNDIYLTASKFGKLEVLKFLEKTYDWNINVKSNDKTDAYLCAAGGGHIEVMKHLEKQHEIKCKQEIKQAKLLSLDDEIKEIVIDESWTINYKNKEGDNAYLKASSGNKVRVMKYLEEKGGCDISVKDNWGQDAFLCAAFGGSIEAMKHLIDKYKWNIYVEDKHDRNAYLVGILYDQIEVLKFLDNLNWGMGENTKNPWLFAAEFGRVEIMRFLKKTHNINVSISANSLNAYLIAATHNKLEVLQFLKKEYPSCYSATYNGLDKKKSYNIRNNSSLDAYLIAASKGYLDIMKHLEKEQKWNIDIYTSYSHKNAYYHAAINGHLEVMEYIEKNHPKVVELKNSGSASPYSKVCEKISKLEEDDETDTKEYKKLKKIIRHLVNQNFKLNKRKDNTNTCPVCKEIFKEKEICCRCIKNHPIHLDCYTEHVITNHIKSDNYTCLYCREKMIESSFEFNI